MRRTRPVAAGMLMGRKALAAGETRGTAAKKAGRAVADEGGSWQDAAFCGEEIAKIGIDTDRGDEPNYAQCRSNAIEAHAEETINLRSDHPSWP